MYAKVEDIFLEEVSVSFNAEKAQTVKRAMKLSFNIQPVSIKKIDEKFHFVLKMLGYSDNDIITFDASYRGIFTFIDMPDTLSEDEHLRFQVICTSKIFPYLRELIADISRRFPGPPIILPAELGDETTLIEQGRKSLAILNQSAEQTNKKKKKPASIKKTTADEGAAKKKKKA